MNYRFDYYLATSSPDSHYFVLQNTGKEIEILDTTTLEVTEYKSHSAVLYYWNARNNVITSIEWHHSSRWFISTQYVEVIEGELETPAITVQNLDQTVHRELIFNEQTFDGFAAWLPENVIPHLTPGSTTVLPATTPFPPTP